MELLLLATALGALIVWWLSSTKARKMGCKIPGPRPYPLVGNLFNFKLTGTKAIQCWDDCMKKYGNTFAFWIGPRLCIFISEPDDMQMILSSQTLLTKGDGYKTLHQWLGTGLLTSSGDLWRKRRKAITPTFHFKILEEFVPVFNKCARTLVNCLKEKVGKGPFLLTEYMSNCSLDAVAETAMGTEINAQTNPLEDYPKSVMRMTQSLADKASNPLLALEPIFTLSGRRKMESDLLKILFSLPVEILKRKKKENTVTNTNTVETKEIYGAKKKTAFLELLLKMKEENVPVFQTDEDIKDEVVTFMFEGHDTTTMALTYTIWLLGLHPEIQEALFHEISDIVGDDEPSIEYYQKMNYLDRIIKESMRLYPPVPVFSRLVTEDIVLPSCGYAVPAGAQVSLFIYSMHRRADLFSEPNKFNPDRFLDHQKHPFAYLPFSGGPRNCIGQKFAILDLKVIISNLILNYKVHSDSELELYREFLLRTSKGPKISLTQRN